MTSRAAGIALGLAVVACGDDGASGDPSGSGGAAATTGTTATGSTSSATGSGPGGGSGGTSSGGGGGGASGGGASGGGGSGGGDGGASTCPLVADAVAAGASFTCAVATTEDATLRCRGGVFGPAWSTVLLEGGARDVCAWGDGGVRCWGETARVAADAPDLAGCPADVAVGDGFACVAWSGFDVVDCWGELPPSIPARVFIAGPAEDVAVGEGFVCARTVSGLVRCWGDDAAGGLGVAGDGTGRGEVEPDWPDGPESVAARAIAAGVRHVATVDGDGPRVLAWGRNDAAQVCSCASELVDTPVDAEHPDPEP